MKKNKYILILVVALAIVAAFLWFSKSSGTISREMMDFAVKDTASITKIFLVDKKNNSILLEKKKPGDWLLNGKYTTSNSMVNMLLETMKRIVPKGQGNGHEEGPDHHQGHHRTGQTEPGPRAPHRAPSEAGSCSWGWRGRDADGPGHC